MHRDDSRSDLDRFYLWETRRRLPSLIWSAQMGTFLTSQKAMARPWPDLARAELRNHFSPVIFKTIEDYPSIIRFSAMKSFSQDARCKQIIRLHFVTSKRKSRHEKLISNTEWRTEPSTLRETLSRHFASFTYLQKNTSLFRTTIASNNRRFPILQIILSITRKCAMLSCATRCDFEKKKNLFQENSQSIWKIFLLWSCNPTLVSFPFEIYACNKLQAILAYFVVCLYKLIS